jgi:hypothetical protein
MISVRCEEISLRPRTGNPFRRAGKELRTIREWGRRPWELPGKAAKRERPEGLAPFVPRRGVPRPLLVTASSSSSQWSTMRKTFKQRSSYRRGAERNSDRYSTGRLLRSAREKLSKFNTLAMLWRTKSVQSSVFDSSGGQGSCPRV